MKEKSGFRFSKKAIDLREKFSSRIIFRSIVIFILSMIIYLFTNTYPITALAGLTGIISGAVIILFVIIFLIFYFLERMKYSKANYTLKVKATNKKTTIKKVAVKKIAKKKKSINSKSISRKKK